MKSAYAVIAGLAMIAGVANAQDVFPFHPPKDKPDMPLSEAMGRYYDIYDGERPEMNELYSQFRYTELKGFDYHDFDGTRVRRDAMAQSLIGSRPNIVFVMTDDQGMNLSCIGHPVVKTPHIDRFAGKSLRLTNSYVSPNCAPTRAAIMSGVHECRAAVTATHAECERMALDLTTFPQLLQQAGYETGILGKWHLGDIEVYRPGNRGGPKC